MKKGVRGPMSVFGSRPNISLGTDAMQKPNRTIELLKPLLLLVDADIVSQLLAPIWRIVAAVHLFFPPRDHAGSH